MASIVVPSYKGAARLPALLDSLAAQEPFTPAFEVIVVIDGVDDGSLALVEDESRIDARPLLFEQNRGRVGALNAGFEAASGTVLIRCDDDLVVPPTYVSAHVRAHAGEQPMGVVGLTKDIHENSAYAAAYGRDAAERSFAYASSRPAEERWRLWAASCSVTRDTWDAMGGYDSHYRAYGWEDVDYGYRLHEAGIPIVTAPSATAQHHGPARSCAARCAKAFDSGAARGAFLALHPGSPLAPATASPGVWGRAVDLLARAMQRAGSPGATPRLVDSLLPFLPVSVGRKLVALHVEAAGLAGSRTSEKAHA